jgi:hypothetical protein
MDGMADPGKVDVLSKTISLAKLNAGQLERLKAIGSCEIDLREEIFDLDFPGHYMRRIYADLEDPQSSDDVLSKAKCTVTLLWSSIRTSTDIVPQYGRSRDQNGTRLPDARFLDLGEQDASDPATLHSVQADAATFMIALDLSSLPFGGAGAISRWRFELLTTDVTTHIDYSQIADMILQFRYTARDGGQDFREAAIGWLQELWQQASLPEKG